MNFVGMYFFRDSEDTYHTGEIVEKISDEVYLLKIDGQFTSETLQAFHIEEFGETANLHGLRDVKRWFFFKDKKDFDDFIDYLEEPSKIKIVKF